MRTYPKQINAIVETELEEIYGRPVAHDITVSFCVVTEEKDGKPHSYLDTTEYSTHVLVTGDIEASWLFDISRPGLRLTRKMKLED